MEKVYLQRAAPGYRSVRGEIVHEVQTALCHTKPDIMIDGIFGKETEDTIMAFQRAESIAVDGRLNHATWSRLMNTPAPSLFERCLQLTSDVEGHGFQKVLGNFNGAGLTWGHHRIYAAIW